MCMKGDFFMARHKVEICGVNTANIKVLSTEEVTELFKKMHNGDPFARDDLINEDGSITSLVKSRVGISGVAEVIKSNADIMPPEAIDLIICDDVEVPNTSNTAQKRENLRERLRELDFILSPNGTMIYIGTPHAYDTIYNTGDDID